MRDRFDSEQEIMTCWNVVEDLKFYIANSDTWSTDERMNYINGITIKYDKRFDHMFNLFEECVAKDVFNPVNISMNYSGLESAYDETFDVNLQDLNDGYLGN